MYTLRSVWPAHQLPPANVARRPDEPICPKRNFHALCATTIDTEETHVVGGKKRSDRLCKSVVIFVRLKSQLRSVDEPRIELIMWASGPSCEKTPSVV